MAIQIFAGLFTLLGDLLIAVSIYRVHSKLSEEKDIDRKVILEVNLEKKLIIIGSILLVIGFSLDALLIFVY